MRASDVPTYVQYGAADFGIAGKDVLVEHAAEHPGGLYQPLDLNIARCRLCVAAPKGFAYEAAVRTGSRLPIATQYVQAASELLEIGRAACRESACMLTGMSMSSHYH